MATLITLERLNLAIKNLQSTVTSLVSMMPTKVSQLVNDSNYMTAETTNKLISTETARAKEAEESLADSISSNEDNLAAEIKRATSAEQANASSMNTLQSDLAAEVDRAKAAESTNSNNIASLKTSTDNEFATVTERILNCFDVLDAEVARAKAAEKTNADNIASINTQLDGVADALATI